MMKTINGAMRNIFTIGIVLLSAAVFGGCTSSLYSNYNNDDLYGTHDRVAIAKAEARQAEIEKAEAEARRAKYEALLAAAAAAEAEREYNESLDGSAYGYGDIVADTYESAYARRAIICRRAIITSVIVVLIRTSRLTIPPSITLSLWAIRFGLNRSI